MVHATVRWVIYLAAIFVVGPVLHSILGDMRSPLGLTVATPFLAESSVRGLGSLVIWVAAAGVLGVVASRVSTVRTGLIAAGLVLCWPAWMTSTAEAFIREAGGLQPMYRLLVEAAITGAFIAGLAVVINHRCKVEFGTDAQPKGGWMKHMLSPEIGKVLLAGVLAGGAAAWFIAISPLKGQSIPAAALAGLAAGAAGRLASHEARPALLVLPMVVLAFAGPLSAILMHGSNALVAADAGRLFPLANILPLEMLAGGLIGVAWGEAWAHSMIAKHPQSAGAANPA
jgi:hypothetical protein